MKYILFVIFLLICCSHLNGTSHISTDTVEDPDMAKTHIFKEAIIKNEAIKEFLSEVFHSERASWKNYSPTDDFLYMVIHGNNEFEYSLDFKLIKSANYETLKDDVSNERRTFIVNIDGKAIFFNCNEDCELLEPTGVTIEIKKDNGGSVLNKILGEEVVEQFWLYYKKGILEIVNHTNFQESGEDQLRVVGRRFYDNVSLRAEDELFQSSESADEVRRFYVAVVKVEFPALDNVLKRDIIPFAQDYSFLPEDGSIYVELTDSSARIIFYPNLKTYSAFWDDALVRTYSYEKNAVFFINDRPVRIRTNEGNPFVESAHSFVSYVDNVALFPRWMDVTQDSFVWEYDIVDNKLRPKGRFIQR